jgi:hypothetical protein
MLLIVGVGHGEIAGSTRESKMDSPAVRRSVAAVAHAPQDCAILPAAAPHGTFRRVVRGARMRHQSAQGIRGALVSRPQVQTAAIGQGQRRHTAEVTQGFL